jgi:hypothetical protein
MAGFVEAVGVDLKRLHETWMELFFPRQRGGDQSVLGKWKPETTSDRLAYNGWAAVGALFVALAYPFALAGVVARYNAYRLDDLSSALGVVGTVLLVALLWGALSAAAWVRFTFTGFLAVAAAAGVATLSTALALAFARVGGRVTTVVLAYPFATTAVFLPPVVAAFYSPVLGELVFTESESLAIWFLDNVFAVGGINEYLRTEYDLTGVAYVLLWLGVSVPLGWALGVLVTLANLIRPTE